MQGFPLGYVISLPIPAFSALHKSLVRVRAQEKIEKAYTSFVAAQASGKDLKKWVNQWKPALDLDRDTTGGMKAFLAKFGDGV